MGFNLRNVSVNVKVIGLFVWLMVINLASYTYIYNQIRTVNSSALEINIAGRQRMLNQRFFKEVLLIQEGVEAKPEVTREVLLKSVKSLRDGGSVPLGKGKVAWLPGTQDEVTRNLLNQQEENLNGIFKSADVLSLKTKKEEKKALLNDLLKAVNSNHVVANNAVTELQKTAVESFAAMKKFVIASSIITIILGFVGIFYIKFHVLNKINTSMAKLKEQVDSTLVASHKLHRTNAQLNLTTSTQVSSVSETVAAISEMKAMSRSTAMNSQEGLKAVEMMNIRAESGEQRMKQLMSSVQRLDDNLRHIRASATSTQQDTSAKLGQIIDILEDVEKKTDVINDIVLKTQLLSFNASIEASRAGSQGKGFVLVAQEVGNLARTTGNAALEIQNLLGHSRKEVQQISDAVNSQVVDVKEKVSECSQLSDKTRELGEEVNSIMSQNFQSTKLVTDKVSGVANANSEQEKGIEQMNIAMGEISSSSEKLLNSVKSNEDVSSQLTDVSEDLGNVIDNLYHMVAGGELKQNKRVEKMSSKQGLEEKQASESTVHTDLTGHNFDDALNAIQDYQNNEYSDSSVDKKAS